VVDGSPRRALYVPARSISKPVRRHPRVRGRYAPAGANGWAAGASMRRIAILAVTLARMQAANSAVVLDDLEARAVAALHGIARAEIMEDANSRREPLRRKLEASLGFAHMKDAGATL
jgi:hypothetical protein